MFCYVIIVVTVLLFLGKVINKWLICTNDGRTCLVGKTVIVTGANVGIGYETALEFATRGARVIMAVRNVEPSEVSRQKIISETGNPNVILKHLDLASNESVRKFAEEFKALPDVRLDILVNNAGIVKTEGKTAAQRVGLTIQVNYLGHFLLTCCLVDILKQTKNAKIVHVSSVLAFFGNLTVANMCEPNEIFQYGKSKLCQLIASAYFAEKLKDFDVTSNSVHPGLTLTNIHHITLKSHCFLVSYVSRKLINLYAQTAQEGANTVLDACLNKKWDNVTNKFFYNNKPWYMPKKCLDLQFCEAIISKSKQLVNLQETEDF